MNEDSRQIGHNDEQVIMRQEVDDRQGLLGLLALISLAIPALLIRYLFPEINPVILGGLGVAVYAAYLSVLLMAVSRQAGNEVALEPAEAMERVE
jgi:drug/metabolite transporter (DMT)-like permease